MAGVTGLEPAASGVTGRRSNQLSYTPRNRPELGTAGRRHVLQPPQGVKRPAGRIFRLLSGVRFAARNA